MRGVLNPAVEIFISYSSAIKSVFPVFVKISILRHENGRFIQSITIVRYASNYPKTHEGANDIAPSSYTQPHYTEVIIAHNSHLPTSQYLPLSTTKGATTLHSQTFSSHTLLDKKTVGHTHLYTPVCVEHLRHYILYILVHAHINIRNNGTIRVRERERERERERVTNIPLFSLVPKHVPFHNAQDNTSTKTQRPRHTDRDSHTGTHQQTHRLTFRQIYRQKHICRGKDFLKHPHRQTPTGRHTQPYTHIHRPTSKRRLVCS